MDFESWSIAMQSPKGDLAYIAAVLTAGVFRHFSARANGQADSHQSSRLGGMASPLLELQDWQAQTQLSAVFRSMPMRGSTPAREMGMIWSVDNFAPPPQ